jgi:aldehyde:ferredoxin oxidoreductase
MRGPVDLEPLIDAFYRACGWNRESGIPTREKLTELGLEEIAGDLGKIVSSVE